MSLNETSFEKIQPQFANREISWLSFNERVLQEAEDKLVPLLMRMKFLGIFSNNLDEFFRVRVATLKRMTNVNSKVKKELGFSPKRTLEEIYAIVVRQQQKFEEIYDGILEELAAYKIFIINEQGLSKKRGKKVKDYFHEKVRPVLVPLMISDIEKIPHLKDGSIYLAVRLSSSDPQKETRYSLIEVPTKKISRFLVLEKSGGKTFIILLDDVIRYCLDDIFAIFGYDDMKAYTIKITKDAETELDTDVSKSFLELMKISIQQRKHGRPVRFIHDQTIPSDLLAFLMKRLDIAQDDNIIPAGRYHNFKDFMNFPMMGPPELRYKDVKPLPHKDIVPNESMFDLIRRKDIMLHLPYQSFLPVIDFLREAAIDPDVVFIKTTFYRLAKDSNVVNALVNAHMNGKKVSAVLELQARFDEAANIEWAKKLQEVGIKVMHGPPGQKIHSKLLLIGRRNKEGKIELFAHIGTGNFHEGTAKVYADEGLFTAHRGITKDVKRVFDMIVRKKTNPKFQHLLVSPDQMINKLYDFINTEIDLAKEGREASIIAKMNSLNDIGIIKKLYEASQAGVKIRLIVRGICALVPGVPGLSENIEAISIVDKYLEHSRIMIFGNGGEERVFIGSADWMERNLHRRIEVSCPIYDKSIQTELKAILFLQLNDNTKARILNHPDGNVYKKNDKAPTHAQEAIYQYLADQLGTAQTPSTIFKE